jgi:hypothetical protein
MLGQVKSCFFRLVQFETDKEMSGQVNSLQAKLGQDRLG